MWLLENFKLNTHPTHHIVFLLWYIIELLQAHKIMIINFDSITLVICARWDDFFFSWVHVFNPDTLNLLKKVKLKTLPPTAFCNYQFVIFKVAEKLKSSAWVKFMSAEKKFSKVRTYFHSTNSFLLLAIPYVHLTTNYSKRKKFLLP